MHSYENVTLTRDVDATRIPSGEKDFIPKGTEVTITQVLGGTYTVQFIGGLARIGEGAGAKQVAWNAKRIKRGDLVLMEAMGGGFTWGAALMRW